MDFRVLRLRGVDEAQQLMDFETFGGLGQKIFELGGSFRKLPGVVVRYCGLELLVQFLSGLSPGLPQRPRRAQENRKSPAESGACYSPSTSMIYRASQCYRRKHPGKAPGWACLPGVSSS